MEPSISQLSAVHVATLFSAQAPAKCYDPKVHRVTNRGTRSRRSRCATAALKLHRLADHERVVVARPIELCVEWKQRRT